VKIPTFVDWDRYRNCTGYDLSSSEIPLSVYWDNRIRMMDENWDRPNRQTLQAIEGAQNPGRSGEYEHNPEGVYSSLIDPSIRFSKDQWVFSIVVSYAVGPQGHSFVAIEGVDDGGEPFLQAAHYAVVREGVSVTEIVRRSLTEPWNPGKREERLEARVKEITEFGNKALPRHFDPKKGVASRSWQISRSSGLAAQKQISNDRGINAEAPDFRLGFLGGSSYDPQALSCAAWAARVADAAKVDAHGILFDIPRTQVWPGSRSSWLTGAAGVAVLTLYGLWKYLGSGAE
jgi:hypothetical protein